MTAVAERDQIGIVIGTGVAAKSLVMDFEVGHRPAELTAPAIPAQHSLAQFAVLGTLESDQRSFREILIHWTC